MVTEFETLKRVVPDLWVDTSIFINAVDGLLICSSFIGA